jgi:hypothetical protein
VVKMTGLIMNLPSDHTKSSLQRAMKEMLSSQKKMLGRLGKEDDKVEDEKMKKIIRNLQQVNAGSKQPNIDVLYVITTMLSDPLVSLQKVNESRAAKWM